MFEANFGKGEYLSVKWAFRKLWWSKLILRALATVHECQ
jgi:hypothetical protein